jgi:lactate permease
MSPVLVVSLQCVGGGIGNMICINNVVAVCSTVNIKGVEGRIVARNMIPVILYCAIVLLVSAAVLALGIDLMALGA